MQKTIYTILAFMAAVFVVAIVFFRPDNNVKPQPNPTPTQSAQPTATQTPASPQPTSPGDIGQPLDTRQAILTDPQDTNPKLAAKERALRKKYALLQHLPYNGQGYTIEFVDVDKSGKTVIQVTYPSTLAKARQKSQSLLKRYQDGGEVYKVVYQHG